MALTALVRHQVCRVAAAVKTNAPKRFAYVKPEIKLQGREFKELYNTKTIREWDVKLSNVRKQCIREMELQRRRDKYHTPADKLFSRRRTAIYNRNLILNNLENARIAAYR